MMEKIFQESLQEERIIRGFIFASTKKNRIRMFKQTNFWN
jgi:hypothetical protein